MACSTWSVRALNCGLIQIAASKGWWNSITVMVGISGSGARAARLPSGRRLSVATVITRRVIWIPGVPSNEERREVSKNSVTGLGVLRDGYLS